MSTRLNKLLADRGIGARRKCDLLIQEGHVRVNGRIVTEPGTQIEEQRDRVEVNGRGLPGKQQLVYWVLNKPVGVITTLEDPQGRPTVAMYLPKGARLFPVGRLDADTSGLLMLTNDGELAHKLMHPRYGVQKFYRVRLDREPTRGQLERIARGVEIEPGFVTAPARARRIDPGFEAIMIEVVVHEGRFRQVRRMCEKVGMRVTGLHRVGYGPVRLGPLPRGMYRELSEDEVDRLRRACARPLNRDGSPTRESRATAAPGKRPVAPKKPVAPVAPEDEGEEFEETWIAGGGFAPEDRESDFGMDAPDEPAEGVWPARAGGRRGDAGFQAPARKPAAGKPERAPAPRRDEGGPLPWHGAEYRRGAAPKPGSKAARSAPVGKLGRRAEARESAIRSDEKRELARTEERARERALERVRLKVQRKESGTRPVPGDTTKRRFGDRRDTRVPPRSEERAPAPRGRFGGTVGAPPSRGPAPRGRFGGDADAPRGRAPAPRGRFGGTAGAPPSRGPAPRGRFGGDADAPRGRAPAPRGRFGGDADAPRGRAPAPRGRFGGTAGAPPSRGPAPRGRFGGDADAPRGRAPAPRGRFGGDAGAPPSRGAAPRGRFGGGDTVPKRTRPGSDVPRRGGAGVPTRGAAPRGKSPRPAGPAGRRGSAPPARGGAPRGGNTRPGRGDARGGRRK
ncbi:MAG: pseudouridine synthase [Candidatus Eisenbacteria bacterium]|nr:pseudouridine synthase [Candidatus Eisenbacteria bacterium]